MRLAHDAADTLASVAPAYDVRLAQERSPRSTSTRCASMRAWHWARRIERDHLSGFAAFPSGASRRRTTPSLRGGSCSMSRRWARQVQTSFAMHREFSVSQEFLRPLSELQTPAKLLGVLTDIDDTLTTDGVVPGACGGRDCAPQGCGPEGRAHHRPPVGWSVPFASAWPVDAIVAENGAVALRRNAQGGLDKLYQQSADERARNFARMQQVLEQIEVTIARRQTRHGLGRPRMRYRRGPQQIHEHAPGTDR